MCRSCNKTLQLEQYETIKKVGRRQYYHATCRTCRKEARHRACNSSPDLYIRRAVSQLRSSRRKRNPDMPFIITGDDMVELFRKQKGRCALTGEPMTWKRDGKGTRFPYNISIDRIDPKGCYVIENVQLITTSANMMKGTWSDDTFIRICHQVARHRKCPPSKRERPSKADSSGDGVTSGWRPTIPD